MLVLTDDTLSQPDSAFRQPRSPRGTGFHMIGTGIKRAVGVAGVTAAILASALPAFATTFSQGPASWVNGDQTGRYRAHTGTHYIKLTCTGSSRYSIDLRVDVISDPDVSEGYFSYACNSQGHLGGTIDSYATPYRGHYMQSHSTWYGTLADNHP